MVFMLLFQGAMTPPPPHSCRPSINNKHRSRQCPFPLQDGRVVFMLPFQGAVIAGTTDAPCPLTDRPRAQADEVAFILAAISDFLNIKVCGCVCVCGWGGGG